MTTTGGSLTKPTRKVRTLKHGKGKVHELHCPWLDGRNAKTDRTKYHEVPASQVRGKAHCSHC